MAGNTTDVVDHYQQMAMGGEETYHQNDDGQKSQCARTPRHFDRPGRGTADRIACPLFNSSGLALGTIIPLYFRKE
jgi:hypothetical protein